MNKSVYLKHCNFHNQRLVFELRVLDNLIRFNPQVRALIHQGGFKELVPTKLTDQFVSPRALCLKVALTNTKKQID